jgi:hypothetical protein
MDKKYLGKAVPLPKEVHEKLEKFLQRESDKLGFKMSLSDAIARLLKMEEEWPRRDIHVRSESSDMRDVQPDVPGEVTCMTDLTRGRG